MKDNTKGEIGYIRKPRWWTGECARIKNEKKEKAKNFIKERNVDSKGELNRAKKIKVKEHNKRGEDGVGKKEVEGTELCEKYG